MKTAKNNLYYLVAIMCVTVWGCTFVSTKVLLEEFSATQIMLLRFVLAYIVLFALHPKIRKINLKQEIWFVLACFTGVVLYFLTENIALGISSPTNVSLLVTTAPIFTAVFAHFLTKEEKLNKFVLVGLFVAFVGVALVVFNGSINLKLNPLGDLLAISSALCWAVYSMIIKRFENKFNNLEVTRKIFFYGIVMTLPMALSTPFPSIAVVTLPSNLFNLLFLGLVASAGCFVVWNKVLWNLGTTKATNFLYFIPFATMICSAIVLQEQITWMAILGGVLISLGVWLGGKFARRGDKFQKPIDK